MTTLPTNHAAWHLADATGRIWWDHDRARLLAHVGPTPRRPFVGTGTAFGYRIGETPCCPTPTTPTPPARSAAR